MFKLIFVILTFQCYFAENARILALIPLPSYSHQIIYRPIWRELARRGHDVVVATTDPEDDPTSTVEEINVSSSYQILKSERIIEIIDENKFNPYVFHTWGRRMFMKFAENVLTHPQVQDLLNNQTEHFDLLLAEVFSVGLLGFQRRFNCPLIALLSLDLDNTFHAFFGNPTHSVSYPDMLVPAIGGKMTFSDRLMSVVYDFVSGVSLRMTNYVCFPEEVEFMKRHFSADVPHFEEILRLNVSLVMVYSIPTFNTRPVGAGIINFGGGIHFQPQKPLPKHLQSFMDASKEGVIYMSLGTNVINKLVTTQLRTIFLDTFRELPYNVIWRFSESNLTNLPENVRILKWAPQQDILRHPKMKLLIFQGGLQSLEEALLSTVPMIGIPFIFDQHSNIKKLELNGYGVYVDKDSLTKEIFKEAIYKVINDSRYKRKVTEVAEIIKDQPLSSLEKAVWWIEYVLRHKGARHLRNPIMDLPLYQYYLIDVIGFLLFCLFVVYVSLKFLFQSTLNIFSTATSKKIKTK